MTTYNEAGTEILPREIMFTGIDLPAKRSVSVIFENGTERAVTFHFTYLDYNDDYIVEVYWWESSTKVIGFYGIIEEGFPFEVKNIVTGKTEFIVFPRLLNAEEVIDNRVKTMTMSPKIWIYEVNGL